MSKICGNFAHLKMKENSSNLKEKLPRHLEDCFFQKSAIYYFSSKIPEIVQ